MRSIPAQLFHYTSASNGMNILSSGEIWTLDVRFSNDKLEGRYFVDHCVRTFSSLADQERDKKLGSVMQRVAGLYEFVGANATCLSFCMSEDHDLLSQWNAYAQQATGICIGFHTETLDFEQQTMSFLTNKGFGEPIPFVQQIKYGPQARDKKILSEYKRTRNTAKRYLEEMYEHMHRYQDQINSIKEKGFTQRSIESVGPWSDLSPSIIDAVPETERSAIFQDQGFFGLTRNFENFVFNFKHPSFHQEREWRLQTTLIESFKRTETLNLGGKTRIAVKHKMAEFPRNPVLSVTLGPLCEISEGSMETFLDEHGYKNIFVHRSQIPLQR